MFMSVGEGTGGLDVVFLGVSLPWFNNRSGIARISKRLDGLLINGVCSDFCASISVVHLARHLSDHASLKISFASRLDNKLRPFLFLDVWTTKPELLEVIRSA